MLPPATLATAGRPVSLVSSTGQVQSASLNQRLPPLGGIDSDALSRRRAGRGGAEGKLVAHVFRATELNRGLRRRRLNRIDVQAKCHAGERECQKTREEFHFDLPRDAPKWFASSGDTRGNGAGFY